MTSRHANEGLQDDLRGARVLVIEDETKLLELITLILTRQGCEVLSATNGPDGIRIAEAQQPDVILLDMFAPEESGIEVLEHLRSGELTRRIPIIVIRPVAPHQRELPPKQNLSGTIASALYQAHVAARKEGGYDAHAVPGLLDALSDRREWVRRAAVEALGEIGDPCALPGLLDALGDQSGSVRRSAAEALGRIGTPEALAALEEWRRGQS
jgi:CheY-like chemotaxis protein